MTNALNKISLMICNCSFQFRKHHVFESSVRAQPLQCMSTDGNRPGI